MKRWEMRRFSMSLRAVTASMKRWTHSGQYGALQVLMLRLLVSSGMRMSGWLSRNSPTAGS